MPTGDKTIFLRCRDDGEPLLTVTMPERGAVLACPACGRAWSYKEIGKKVLGTPAGILSEKLLAELREQAGFVHKKGG